MSENQQEILPENETKVSEQPKLTDAQIRQLRNDEMKYYLEETKYLEPKVKYHKLKAEMEEYILRSMKAQIEKAQIYAAFNPENQPKQDEPTPEELDKAKDEVNDFVKDVLKEAPSTSKARSLKKVI